MDGQTYIVIINKQGTIKGKEYRTKAPAMLYAKENARDPPYPIIYKREVKGIVRDEMSCIGHVWPSMSKIVFSPAYGQRDYGKEYEIDGKGNLKDTDRIYEMKEYRRASANIR